MMENQQFIDAECAIDRYFDKCLAERLKFRIDCRNSAMLDSVSTRRGVMNTIMPSEEYATDTRLNFPANDIEKVCTELNSDQKLSKVVDELAATWRRAAISKIGQARYDELSKRLGTDLARAYVDHRLLMRMVDYEVAKNPIEGSVDYILDEARRNSLLSYTTATISELQQFIDKKVVERYNPSLLERGAGKALGSLTDMALTSPMLGVGSWATLGKFLAVDLGIGFVGDSLESSENKDNDVSRMVSAALFNGDGSVLEACRKQTSTVSNHGGETIKGVSGTFTRGASVHKIGLTAPKLPDVPDYTAQLRRDGEQYFANRENKLSQEQKASEATEAVTSAEQNHAPLQTSQPQQVTGWNGLFDTLGLSDFGSVGKNLGYVLAMLPDMLVGMFTGKTRNLKFGDNMLPIASIIAGMFVKNPLLKMLLVGLGGANLLNKAGHEAIENRDGIKPQPVRQFRKYDDEPLDLRIGKPAMKGNTLIATIDNIPNVITISDDAVDAYYKGILPLNTLANAVLRKYDEQQQMIQENYSRELSQGISEERTVALR